MRVGLRYRKKHYKQRAVLIVAILLIAFCIILKRLEPAFNTQLACYANTIVTNRVNRTVYDVFKGYGSFSEISHNADGRVTSQSANTPDINRIKADATVRVQKELDAITSDYIKIPLMSISDFPVLSGMGISVPIKVVPMTLVDAEFDESFISNGINQTRHKIDMIIKVRVLYSGFALNKQETIETQIPLVNTVINGDVPQYYGNLSGTEGVFD